MAISIPGASAIIGGFSVMAKNMARVMDSAEFQLDLMDSAAGTVFDVAKNYRRQLRSDMDLTWNKYQAAGNFEKRVTYEDLDSYMLRAVRGDKEQFIRMHEGRGLSEEEITETYDKLMKNGEMHALDGKYDPNSIDAKIAENIKYLKYDMPVYDMEKIVKKRHDTYEMIKDNPNYTQDMKDFFKPSMIDIVDFQKIIQGARDMQLCDVMEDRRNRHESDLGNINVHNALRGKMMDEYKDSAVRFLGSMHSQLFKDKRQALRFLPVGEENRGILKKQLNNVIEEMRSLHKDKGNRQSQKFWNEMTSDQFVEKFESEEFINKLTHAGKQYQELIEEGAEIHLLKPHQTLGQALWGMWVNSADANLFAGESQTSLHTKIYHKKAMQCLDKDMVFTANQWFDNGEYYWIDKSVSLRSDNLDSDISDNVFVSEMQTYFSKDENRNFVEDTFGYVFDYDGIDPKSVSWEDLYFIDRKAKEVFTLETKNPSRTFGAEKLGGSLQTSHDKHAFIRGTLEFRTPETLAEVKNLGNIPGQEIKYKKKLIRGFDNEPILDNAGERQYLLVGGGKSYSPDSAAQANRDPKVVSITSKMENQLSSQQDKAFELEREIKGQENRYEQLYSEYERETEKEEITITPYELNQLKFEMASLSEEVEVNKNKLTVSNETIAKLEKKIDKMQVKAGNPVIKLIDEKRQEPVFAVNKLELKTYEALANLTNHIASETGGASPVKIRDQIRGHVNVWDVPSKPLAKPNQHWEYDRKPVADPKDWDYEMVKTGKGKTASEHRVYEDTTRLNQLRDVGLLKDVNKLTDPNAPHGGIGPEYLKKSNPKAVKMMWDYVSGYINSSIVTTTTLASVGLAKSVTAPLLGVWNLTGGNIAKHAFGQGDKFKFNVSNGQIRSTLLATTMLAGAWYAGKTNLFGLLKPEAHKEINLNDDPVLKNRLNALSDNSQQITFEQATIDKDERYLVSNQIIFNDAKAISPSEGAFYLVPEDGMTMSYETSKNELDQDVTTVRGIKTTDGTMTIRYDGNDYEIDDKVKISKLQTDDVENGDVSKSDNLDNTEYKKYFEINDSETSKAINSSIDQSLTKEELTGKDLSNQTTLSNEESIFVSVDGVVLTLSSDINIKLDDDDKVIKIGSETEIKTPNSDGTITIISSDNKEIEVNVKKLQENIDKNINPSGSIDNGDIKKPDGVIEGFISKEPLQPRRVSQLS